MSRDPLDIPAYAIVLDELKARISRTQYTAALAANRELVLLYWEIGTTILEQQQKQGWGTKVIDRLAKDLGRSFPNMKGFSPRNLKYMRKFAETYPDRTIVQQLIAQIPWGHNVRILDRAGKPEEREWYVQQTIAHGWSQNVLVHQIELDLYGRQKGQQKITNFQATLPAPQSDLAQQTIKDPYVFDFLAIAPDAKELELQSELLQHITKFLLELGTGFAFVGSQYRLEVSGRDFFIDLLFYHLALRCYVVIELKTGEFKPEYAGQLNFYLSAVDSQVKAKEDNPSIGIILCKAKDRIIAEYALRNMAKPMGVSEYTLTSKLPRALKGKLPDTATLQGEIQNEKEN